MNDDKLTIKKLTLQNAALRHTLKKQTSYSMVQIADLLALDLDDRVHQNLAGGVTVSDIAIENAIRGNEMLSEYIGDGRSPSQKSTAPKLDEKPDYHTMSQRDKTDYIQEHGESAFCQLMHDARQADKD